MSDDRTLPSHSDDLEPTVDSHAPEADTTPSQADYKPSTEIGPYRLLQRIGVGGMGEVWSAEQLRPVRRRVAVKIIKRGMDTREVVMRFEAERQALALMNHPNVARVFDAGETTRQRFELMIQICEGVQHAHQKGIIHRDLKPSNILVTVEEGGGRRTPVPRGSGNAEAASRDRSCNPGGAGARSGQRTHHSRQARRGRSPLRGIPGPFPPDPRGRSPDGGLRPGQPGHPPRPHGRPRQGRVAVPRGHRHAPALPPGPPDDRGRSRGLASVESFRGYHEAALDFREQAIAVYQLKLDAGHPKLVDGQLGLAGVLIDQNKGPEAESLLQGRHEEAEQLEARLPEEYRTED